MTVKLSISVPDDVAAYLHSQGNASAAAVEADDLAVLAGQESISR